VEVSSLYDPKRFTMEMGYNIKGEAAGTHL